MRPGRKWLIAAAVMSAAAALIHIACIFGGADWYRFLGAGEKIAQMAEAGLWRPTILTSAISVILAGWAIYALAGAAVIGRVPLLRTGLVAIITVLMLRAFAYFLPSFWGPDADPLFMAWSSLIVFVMGATFAIGTFKAWPEMSKRA